MELALPQEEALEEGVMLEARQTISATSQSYHQIALEKKPRMHTATGRQTFHSQPSATGGSLLHQSQTPIVEKTFKQTAQKGFQAQSTPEVQPRIRHGLSVSRNVVSTEFSNGQRQDLIELNDAEGQTALHLAVASSHLEIIKILLDNGANVSSCNAMGRNLFHIAAGNGSLGALEILLQKIHRLEHHLTESSTTLEENEGNKGGTFSHLATFDKNGWTPLHFAAAHGHDRVVDRLLKVCPTLIKHTDNPSCHGWTPLQLACKSGYLSVAEHLLRASADPNTHSKGGNARTALQAAAEGGHLEVVELLLKAGADVNASPDQLNGKTPLQAAASGGHLEVFRTLLASGADVSAPAAEVGGRTALQAAEDSGDIETFEKIINAIQEDAGSSLISTPHHERETSSDSYPTSKSSPLASIVEEESNGDISNGATKEATTVAAKEEKMSLLDKDTDMHRQPDKQGSTHDDALIIGIEFGAEFSKVSYLFTEFYKPTPSPHTICRWPGLDSLSYQVPSIMNYDDEAKGSFKWGYEADPDSPNSIKQFSQLLDPHSSSPIFVPRRSVEENLRNIARQRKSSIIVACDYLDALYDHAYKDLEENSLDEYLQTLRVQVVLTIPDLTSDQGRTNFYSVGPSRPLTLKDAETSAGRKIQGSGLRQANL
jgi:ankyrin repeat protein